MIILCRAVFGKRMVSLGYRDVEVEEFEETMDNGKTYLIREFGDNDQMDNTKIYEVPEGHYFMMGDNRDRSKDSRFADVGFVPFENLIGRAEFLFFSVDQSASFGKYGNGHLPSALHALFSSI